MASVAMTTLMILGTSSCADELNQSIKDPQTNTEFDGTAFLAKVYSSLSLTGQTGGSGNPDMSQFDEGNSGFYRRIFEANELCSDVCIWTWQGDDGIPELTNISWSSSHGKNELTYYRIMYNVTLCNSYLDQTEGTEDAQILQNRAEVRFLRALYMSYFVDLYGKAPFKEHVSEELPIEYSRQQAFDFVVSELKAINGETADSREVLMDFACDDNNYGRADKVAANLLLARMYLNAEIYTGTPQWKLAADYATKVINSNYKLYDASVANPYPAYSRYAQIFMGNNGENPAARAEIILPIRCDGQTSRSYAGSIYPIASATGNDSPAQGLSSSMWGCNRARQSLIDKFFEKGTAPLDKSVDEMVKLAGDDRAMFFSKEKRTYETEEKTTFTAGFSILKWSNEYSDGGTPSNVSFPDTDVPFMRIAEAYLTRAEANFRLSGSNTEVTDDINKIRQRANASKVNIVNEMDILDEWCREFYFEGRRRMDLIRFGKFTSADYKWDWKGGQYAGAGVRDIYNLYPIPYNEIKANPNMTQNPDF